MRRPLKIVRPWEPMSVMFVGDPHLEAPSHDKRLFGYDMDRAQANGDSIWILGDVFDMILRQDVKRFSAAHGMAVDAVINEVVDRGYERLRKYADSIDLIMVGNHETAVLKYHAADPVAMLIKLLNREKKSGVFEDRLIHHGGYVCWVQLQFVMNTKDGKRKASTSQKILLHHGTGGGAKVTKGMIDGNRIKVANVFDLCVIGHKHTNVDDPDTITYLDDYGNLKVKDRDFFVVGGYNGADVEQDPDRHGYMLDYSDEKHYDRASMGSVRVRFFPMHSQANHRDDIWIRRNIERERQPFPA